MHGQVDAAQHVERRRRRRLSPERNSASRTSPHHRAAEVERLAGLRGCVRAVGRLRITPTVSRRSVCVTSTTVSREVRIVQLGLGDEQHAVRPLGLLRRRRGGEEAPARGSSASCALRLRPLRVGQHDRRLDLPRGNRPVFAQQAILVAVARPRRTRCAGRTRWPTTRPPRCRSGRACGSGPAHGAAASFPRPSSAWRTRHTRAAPERPSPLSWIPITPRRRPASSATQKTMPAAISFASSSAGM